MLYLTLRTPFRLQILRQLAAPLITITNLCVIGSLSCNTVLCLILDMLDKSWLDGRLRITVEPYVLALRSPFG